MSDDNQSEGRRSWRPFPRYSLRTAEAIARKILSLGGDDGLGIDTLASALGHRSSSSGTFRTKLAAARAYGAVAYDDDRIQLGSLGASLAAPTSDDELAQVRKAAFSNVEPFESLWQRFAGRAFPNSDEVVHNIIVRELGYPAHSAAEFLKIFREAGREAGLLQRGEDGTLQVTAPGGAEGAQQAPETSAAEQNGEAPLEPLAHQGMPSSGTISAQEQSGPVRVVLQANVSEWSLERTQAFLRLLGEHGLLAGQGAQPGNGLGQDRELAAEENDA